MATVLELCSPHGLGDRRGRPRWGHINAYDALGVPAAGNLGRFQYDGYPWMAEAGLHHLRARAYFPAPGR